ncbi:hypothetical protein MNV49_003548 [Pseudohyphozyma bogoriensis]|nr:hypothetical protein MNV49_003548 [Pseudohyphozyma bogoriensis]
MDAVRLGGAVGGAGDGRAALEGRSQVQEVVRYSALLTGVFYGIVHRRTLQAEYDHSHETALIKKREHWLEEAKKAWAEKNKPKVEGGLVTDPDAPGFDLEAVLKSLE